MRVLGLISGTSHDAIEAAAADFELDGEVVSAKLLAKSSTPYAPELRSRLVAAAALNLGGIANITVVRPSAEPIAYDTGPANALLDAAMLAATNGELSYDRGGERSARGAVDEALLDRLLAEPFYALAAPKSTGK